MNPDWKEFFAGFTNLRLHVNVMNVYADQSVRVFPPRKMLFRAFDFFPPQETRVVIIGQDPYPQPGNACGMAFAVPETQPVPGSLQHIFAEINREYNTPNAYHSPTLVQWASQGVLLLNTILSVAEGKPLSHSAIGWQNFTNYTIEHLSEINDGMVFMLWGNPAQNRRPLIDESKHLVLTATHPSGLSWGKLADGSRRAEQSFWGCNHFIECNKYLEAEGHKPIVW